MSLYRKKPVVIEARQFRRNALELVKWINSDGGAASVGAGGIKIDTLEGVMTARDGDWIIKGTAGEFYPCKPDIFDATYEPAPDGAS